MTCTKPRSKLKAGERTLKHLRNLGYRAEVCEKYIAFFTPKDATQTDKPRGGYRRDLFKFMDVLAYSAHRPGALAVQTTSRQQMSNHLRAYRRTTEISEAILDWLQAGNRFIIHGWERVEVPKKSGDGTKFQWQLTEKLIVPSDLTPNARDVVAMEEAAE
jgi:hypothetical protein